MSLSPRVGFWCFSTGARPDLIEFGQGFSIQSNPWSPETTRYLFSGSGADYRGCDNRIVYQPGQSNSSRFLPNLAAESLVSFELGPMLLNGFSQARPSPFTGSVQYTR